MAGRSKLAGKIVDELTATELPLALALCQQMIRTYSAGPAHKELLKRKQAIEKRIARNTENE